MSKKWTKARRREWSKIQKELWKNKEIRKKRLVGLQSASTKKKRAKKMKEVGRRPEWRIARSEIMKSYWSDERKKKKQSRIMRRYWNNPVWRKKNLPAFVEQAKSFWTRSINSVAMKKDWERRSEIRLKAIVDGAIRAGNKKTYGTKPEIALRKALWNSGLRFVVHYCVVCSNGQRCVPDVVFTKKKVAVFCDGVYWHQKIDVKEKDKRVNSSLRKDGWLVLRFSDLKILKDVTDVVKKVSEVVEC